MLVLGAALQADGKILVAGRTDPASGRTRPVVVRVNAIGAVDRSFGDHGIMVLKIPSAYLAWARSICVQQNGRIVIAGEVRMESRTYSSWLLARFKRKGAIDVSFGTNGVSITDFDDESNAFAINVLDDGRFLVAGSTSRGWSIGRFDAQGHVDSTYGIGGFQHSELAGRFTTPVDMFVSSEGSATATGFDASFNENDFLATRYAADGAPDTTFGIDGVLTSNFTLCDGSQDSRYWSSRITYCSDGKLLIGGSADGTCNGLHTVALALARYLPSGVPDPDFGSSGLAWTPVLVGGIVGIAEERDGKILAGASTYGNFTPGEFNLVRFDANGALDETFGTSGFATNGFGSEIAAPVKLLVQSDGKVLLVGRVGDGVGIIRYLTNAVSSPVHVR